jgi:toxin ParE1/3/4
VTPRYRLTPQAVAELDRLADHIAKDSPAVALRFLEAAQTTFESLSGTPEHGARITTRRRDLRGLRLWRVAGFPNHLFLYRPITEGVEIVRVFHGMSNWEALL